MRADDAVLKDFLIDSGLVSRSQVADALERAAGRPLGAALLEAGLLERDELRRASAHALGVPFVELDPHDIAEEVMLLIPEPLARARNVFAFNLTDQGVEVMVLDLDSLEHLGDIKTRMRVLPRLTSERSMRRALQHYQQHLKQKFGEMFAAGEHMVSALISHALYSRAGGVHIDHTALGTLVRYQIGHTLHEAFTVSEQAGKHLIGQLKSLAKLLPVARPQEGKFKIELGPSSAKATEGRGTVYVRVHSMQGEKGERVHLRLARESQGERGYTLESLGFHGEALDRIERQLASRRGLVAVAGAQGSGKTTLLHTLTDLLASSHTVLVRLPVQAGANSAPMLRATLKHDPDIVVVDDIADEATGVLAQAAAARGVFVLAGLSGLPAQAGDVELAAEVIIRVARVQRLCTKAFHDSAKLSRAQLEVLGPYVDAARVLAALKDEYVVAHNVAWKDILFACATPCSECTGGAGYRGHLGLQQVEDSTGLVGLNIIEDGLFKAAQGLTSLYEVLSLLD